MCCLMVAAEPLWLSMLSRHVDRLDIFNIGEAGSLAPVEELIDRLVVCHPGVLVTDWDREEFEKALGRFRSDIGDDGRNVKIIGSCEG